MMASTHEEVKYTNTKSEGETQEEKIIITWSKDDQDAKANL